MGEKISFIDLFGTELELEDEYAREQLSNESAARAEDVAVLEARMDTFTALPAGSTAGDAELTDIRVGYDGTTYANAGNAVREQAFKPAYIEKVANGNISLNPSLFVRGGLNDDGSINTSQTYYASTENDLVFDYPIFLTVNTGYEYRPMLKTGETTYFNYGNITRPIVINAGQPFKLLIKRSVETWERADLKEFTEQVQYQYKTAYYTENNRAEIGYLKQGKQLLDAFFQNGSVLNGNFTMYALYRIATPNVCRFDRDLTLSIKSGYRFAIHTFDENDVFVSDLSWKTADFTIEAGQGFKLIIAKVTEDTSSIADVKEFYTALSVQTEFKDYVDKRIDSDSGASIFKNPYLQVNSAKLIRHMGYHNAYPENTIPAFEASGKLRDWAIETDIQQTSDGYFVCIHDNTLDRTTSGTGNVAYKTLAEIRALHIKDHPELQVPTLEEYLTICKMYGCLPVIEIKGTITDFAGVVNIIKDFGLYYDCICIGSKWSADEFRNATQDIPYLAVLQSAFYSDYNAEIEYMKHYANSGVDLDITGTITKEMIEKCHNNNMLVFAFTADTDADFKTAFSLGCDGVTSNIALPYE